MSQQPFLLFRDAIPGIKARRTGGGSNVSTPSAERQKERLDGKFRHIVQGFEELQSTIEGLEPEQVIVFETIGDSVAEFAAAAAKVNGLEWVGELDLGDIEPDEEFFNAKRKAKLLPCRLYALMSNQKAMQQLLSLWDAWIADQAKTARQGFGPFKDVFVHLKDVRRWGPKDRLLATGVLEDWQESLTLGRANVLFEIELWFRGDPGLRHHAFKRLDRLILAEGGRCVSRAEIREILYHGVLAELPSESVIKVLERLPQEDYTDLLRCEDIMFFRARAQAEFSLGEGGEEKLMRRNETEKAVIADPIIAVLDGLPLENHDLLRGRLKIDDPDNHAARYQSECQQHGTAMCSLIVHGDLSLMGAPLPRRVYLRPILIPALGFDGIYNGEVTPSDVLLVDLFHRSIRRLFEKDGDHPPVAPSVKIVNLSFGNPRQPFDRQLSPLARLLDWMAWKYKILFLVSAGNQHQDITIIGTEKTWKTLSSEALRSQVVSAMLQDQAFRRPFSPAESINAITVGAWHEDASPAVKDQRVNLFAKASLPSPLGTVSSGFKGAVKPEVFFPGGMQLYHGPMTATDKPARFEIAASNRPPGLKVAAPGQQPMELDRVLYSRGSSDATALASRCVGIAYEELENNRQQPGWDELADEHVAVVLKTLLVHGATWGAGIAQIEQAVANSGKIDRKKLQRILNRFIGCGQVEIGRTHFATDQRATVLGWGNLKEGYSDIRRLPLPPSLNAIREWRRLTVTLAWFTPVNARHKDYRKGNLWTTVGKKDVEKLRMGKAGLDERTSQRGTVQHRCWEGMEASVFNDDDGIEIGVSCAAGAGKLEERIPYGLAVSLEVKEGVNLPIYQEVKERISVGIQPKPR